MGEAGQMRGLTWNPHLRGRKTWWEDQQVVTGARLSPAPVSFLLFPPHSQGWRAASLASNSLPSSQPLPL